MSKDNETFVFDLFDEICPPPLMPMHFGGSAPHCPDIAVIDYDYPGLDAFGGEVIYEPKASYIISGANLCLHENSIDPWDLKGLMADLHLGDDIYLRDKQTKLSKRACGAKRIDSTKGPLIGKDSRTVSMSLRYWVEYPESSLDLRNKYHVDSLRDWIRDLRKRFNYLPVATFEAKLDDKCQYVGPNVAVALQNDSAVFEMRSGAESLDGDEIIAFLNTDPEVQKTVLNYMRTVGVEQSPFKVVASSKETLQPGEAREYAYNSVELNMVLSRNFNLCSSMFNRQTTIRIGQPEEVTA